MIVLDTNVVSELMRRAPAPQVLDWVDGRESAELTVTAITAAELRAGVACLPGGRRRTSIARQVDALLEDTFTGSIVPFDAESAPYYGEVIALRRRSGTPIEPLDAQIAAICLQHDAQFATRNTKDFAGLRLRIINPWAA